MNRIPVAVDQLEAFKLQAKRFAGIVSRLTNNSVTVRKSNREDLLAWICGYKNFSELSLAAKGLPPANAPLVLADVPEKRALLRARCIVNPFGRFTTDVADTAIAQLPTPVTPLVVPIAPSFDDLALFDPTEIEWIYREFTFDACHALDAVRAAVSALNHTSVFEQRTQVFSKVISTLSEQHSDTLRRRLEELKPSAADTIDGLVSEIRSSTRRINEIRFDKSPISETTDVAALYTYWRHGSDVVGKGGISNSAIYRQFARTVSLALMNQPRYVLSTTWVCPACGSNAPLELSDVSYKNVRSMELSCSQCGHDERYRRLHRWTSKDPLNKLRCQCHSCRNTVRQAAGVLAPSSGTLWIDVAQWTRTVAQQEKSRLRSLAERARAMDPDRISHKARLLVAAAAAGNLDFSIWKEVVNIVGYDYRRWRERETAVDSLLDELIEIGTISVEFDDLVDDANDDQLVIRCLFGEQADYFDRLSDRASGNGRYWPSDGPWKGDWYALLSRLQRGFRPDDRDDFKEWLDAVNASNLLSYRFRMPFVLGLYINAERGKYLVGGKRHG